MNKIIKKNNETVDSQPLVSIIIRTKNRTQLLKQSIASLAEQTYSNVELIVINDGGCDVTEVYETFSSMFFAIKLHDFISSSGRSNAANKGLEMAQGQYVGFLDDDDWLAPEHISILVKELEIHPTDNVVAVYASTDCIDTDNNEVVRTYAQEFDSTLLKIENYIPLHALLFKRCVLDTQPICSFDPGLDLYEDWDFWLQLLRHGDFIHSGKVTAFYRIIPGSGEGVYAEEKRSIEALENITEKWVKCLSPKDYMRLIGRTRFLQKQSIELEKKRGEIEQRYEKRLLQEKNSIIENYENEITRLNQERTLEGGKINLHYENEIKCLSVSQKDEIKRLSDSHEGEIKRLSESYDGEIKRLSDSHEGKINRLSNNYEGVVKQLADSQKRSAKNSAEAYEKEIQLEKQQQIISENYENEIKRLSNEYGEILSSTSWQITKPLRFIRRKLSLFDGKSQYVIKKNLFSMAMLVYRMPMLRKLIQRIPFAQKQRIRNFLINNRMPESLEQANNFEARLAANSVSILIPVYNHAEYLRECIDSAINQSWSDTEVLICDDASPDPAVKQILLEYVDHPRCNVLFSEENEGICNTQNKLLAIASGDIIAFLDCDDYLSLDAVERCVQHWKEDTVYLHTGRINVDENGDEINRISFELLPRKDYFEENLERMFATHFKLIHRNAIAKVGAFDPRFDSAQDYEMLMRVAFHYPTEAFVHLPEFLYCHRLHEKQTTEVMNKKQLNDTETIQAEARLRKSIRQGEFKHFISIIMLSYGKKNQTLEAIQSLKKTINIQHEIILFDNGSEADTVNFIKAEIDGHFENVKVFYNDSNLGPAAGRRAALEHASGEWIIIFDNDEIAEPGWLEELLVRANSDKNIGAVCCKVVFPDKSLQFSGGYIRHEDEQLIELDLYDRGINTYDLSTAVFRDCDWCPIGATLFTSNPAVFLHEGYPNVFEDAGVSMALKKQGKRLVNSPGSWVWHEHIVFQKKSEVDMHDKYLSERYNPKRMLTSIKSFYRENNLIIHDEYIWRENDLYKLSRSELIELLKENNIELECA